MEFQVELSQTLEKTPARLDGLSELIDLSWIHQALAATGKASIRRRRLPAEHVVWLVIGLALFRNRPIWHVVRQLDLALDTPKSVCAPSAAVQGRQRLGDEPLAHLFKQLSRAWGAQRDGQAPGLNGLRLLAVDGVVSPGYPRESRRFGLLRQPVWTGQPAPTACRVLDGHAQSRTHRRSIRCNDAG